MRPTALWHIRCRVRGATISLDAGMRPAVMQHPAEPIHGSALRVKSSSYEKELGIKQLETKRRKKILKLCKEKV